MCNAHNHPSDCTCGFGGYGHTGLGFGGSGVSYSFNFINTEWEHRDATWPTVCPECGESVFFIRHNGGCVWVDPPLGPPWPKHGCFDKPSERTPSFDLLRAKAPHIANAKFGVITRMSRRGEFYEPEVEITEWGGERFSVVLRWVPPDDDMLGDIVLYSAEESLLFHLTYAEIPIHSIRRDLETESEWYKCQRCQALVKEGTGHEDYCRRHSKTSPPPRVNRRADRPRRLKYIPKSAWKSPSQSSQKSKLTIEQRVARAVEIVANRAWQEVRHLRNTDRLEQAKKKVLEMCQELNPDIRERVKNALSSKKWKRLKARNPNQK